MERDLQEYVPSRDYLREESTSTDEDNSHLSRAKKEDKRKDAFDEAAEWHPMQYFEDIVAAKLAEHAESRARDDEMDIDTAPTTPTPKPSSRTPKPSGSSGSWDFSNLTVGNHEDFTMTGARPVVKKEGWGPAGPSPIKKEPFTFSSRPIVKKEPFAFGSRIKQENINDEDRFVTQRPRNTAQEVVDLCSSDDEVAVKAESTANSNQNGKKSGSQGTVDEDEAMEGTSNKPNSSKKGKEKAKTTLTQVIPNLPMSKSNGISTHQLTQKTPMFRQAGFKFEPATDEINVLSNTPANSPQSQPSTARAKYAAISSRAIKKVAVKQEISAEEQADSQKQAHVCIGKDLEETYFVTNMAVIKRYPYFTDNLRINDRSGLPCVRTTDLAELEREEFVPVAEYLDNGDYNPILVKGTHPYLLGVHSVNQHEQAAIRAGGVWNRAKYMRIQPLMELVAKKIQTQWPLANDVLLLFTRLIFFSDDSGLEVEVNLRNELKQEIASRFYDLVVNEARLLTRVMKSSDEIASAVGKFLHENPGKAADANVDVEMEDDDD